MKKYNLKIIQENNGWRWYLDENDGFCFTLFDAINEAYVVMRDDLRLTYPTSW